MTLRPLLPVALAFAIGACASGGRKPPPPPPLPTPGAPVEGSLLEPDAEDEELEVRRVAEPIVLAAWAEPSRLPHGGGVAQLLVRVQKRGGRPFPDVEVRLRTSTGALHSAGHVLVTDPRGMTRDQLTTRRTATITLNAGGTRYRFRVPVGEEE
ncbi:MAG: hypothetical protein A2V74_03760 [Acidobacteria bacterium RBG_16_70_10]|nr:MAG: hypothetical protein A2V74_03760 [Acidobacteria bacterium RBG_16_70_10]